MSAARIADGVFETTMLDLVYRLTRPGVDEDTVVETVVSLVRSGHARLIGTFRGVPASVLFPAPDQR